MKRKKYGQIVAEKYKAQYYDKKHGWKTYENWETQPEQHYTILRELRSLKAIEALLNVSWTKKLRKKPKVKK